MDCLPQKRSKQNVCWKYFTNRKPSVFTNSIEQENAELKRINTKLAQEITELKSEIQKYKFNEEKFKNDDQRV